MLSLREILMVPRAVVSERHDFVLFYSPKCGCGTAKLWFLATEGIGTDPGRPNRIAGMTVHQYIRTEWRRFSPSRLGYRLGHHKSIIVVRNPWRRLVSYYCDKVLRRNFLRIDLRTKELPPAETTFEELVRWVCRVPDKHLEPHVRPQTHGRLGIDFDRIVKIEKWQEEIEQFEAALGLPPLETGTNRNRTQYSEGGEFVFAQRPSAFDGVPQYKWFYNDELRELVGRKYKNDAERLGYRFED
jgi:hypothetical protein